MSPRRWAVTLIWVCTCAILQLHCVTAEERCVFPFKYGNKQYSDCLPEHSGIQWCSLTKEFTGKWKICTDNDRPRCLFPFVYNGRLFVNCTRKGSFRRKLWCSLTRNYDLDRAWKYC